MQRLLGLVSKHHPFRRRHGEPVGSRATPGHASNTALTLLERRALRMCVAAQARGPHHPAFGGTFLCPALELFLESLAEEWRVFCSPELPHSLQLSTRNG